MSNLLYAIIFIGLFLLLNLRSIKQLTDPLILHSITWLLVFIVGYFNYSNFYELNNFFWNSWILWFSAYSIGYYIFFLKSSKRKIKIIDYSSIPNYSFFLNLLTLAFFILTIIQGLIGGYGNFLMNLRLSFILKTNYLVQPFLFLFTIIWPLFLYEGVVYKNKKNLLALTFYCLVYTLASGGKFGVLMTFSALFFIFNHRKTIKLNYLIISLILGASLIGIITFYRSHDDDGGLITYSYAPLIAYQSIEHIHNSIWGHETFRFFYSMLNSLGLIETPPPKDFYEYTMTPTIVNVYTALRPFYADFGYYGIFFGGLSYGMFFGYCYNGYLKGKLIRSMLYFGYAFAIISIPFSDLLFLNLSLIVRTIIVATFLFVTINRKIKIIWKQKV